MANDNTSGGLDEAYFAETAGLEPEVVDNGGDNGQQSTTDQPSTANDQQAVDKAASDKQQPASQQPQQKDNQQSQQAPQVATEGLRKHPSGKFVDANGNITEADGSVVASQGRHRREYEENQKLRVQVTQEKERSAILHQEVQSRQFLNGVPQQYGLSNEQVAEGLDFAARIKRGDLLGVARDLVAKAAASGINVSEIVGNNVGDAIDMRAVRVMLDERLAPITRADNISREEAQAREIATRNYNEFVSNNEYADVQGDVIAAYAKSNGVHLQQAYNAVRTFMIQNDLDLSLPLGPQVEERRAQYQQQQSQPQPQGNNNQLRPMPNGVSTRESAVQTATPVYADPDDDWGTIIRRAQSADRPNN